MNLDFKLPMSGKVARRLAYLNTIIPLELDPRIMNHVTRDLLDPSAVQSYLAGTTLNHALNPKQQELVQFIADTDYRAVIGAMTEMEVVEMALTCALSSGRNVIVISDVNSIEWESVLPRLGVQFVTEVDPLQPITAKVVLVNSQKTLDIMKQHGRDRVLVYVPHHYDFDVWHSTPVITGGLSKKQAPKARLQYTVDNICKEFPYCVMGFYLADNVEVDKVKYWSTEKRVVEMVNAINCDNRINKALSLDTNNQSVLLHAGFTRRMPAQIGKILNVNVDMLAARTYFFEDLDGQG